MTNVAVIYLPNHNIMVNKLPLQIQSADKSAAQCPIKIENTEGLQNLILQF
jgi:hypothetical protein